MYLGKSVKVVEVEAYNGTLYTRASRARGNSTQIRHTVLLVKLVLIETRTTLLCILIEYRHRFLSLFLHSIHLFSSFSSNGIAYTLILEQSLTIYLKLQ